MGETVGSKLEAARAHLLHELPIDWILRQRQIPRRAKSVALLEVCHPLDAGKADRTFDVVGKRDAALFSVGPKSDVPAILLANRLQTRFEPFPPDLDQSGFTWPIGKTIAMPRSYRGVIDPMAN